MTLLFLVGFLSLLSQVMLLRELIVASYGVELVYPLAFAAWMLGTAAGALAGFRPSRPSSATVSTLLVALAVVLPAQVALLRGSRILLGGVPGAYLSLPSQGLVLIAALAPPAILLGLLFQRAARLRIAEGGTLPGAYAVESLGAAAGGVTGTVLAMAGAQTLSTVLSCGAASAAAAVVVGPRSRSHAPRRVAAAILATGLAVATAASERLDLAMTSWNHPHVIESADTPYGRVTIEDHEGLVSVHENDALSFETQGTAAEEIAHLAALEHPSPRRILLLGGTLSGLVGELLKHAPERLDAVDVGLSFAPLVLPHLSEEVRAGLRSPAVRLAHDDPRRFLATTDDRYDLILVGMPDPASGQSNRFYTREFFALASRRLADDGVLAFRLSSSENFLAPPLARRLASIARAVRGALPEVSVLPGPTNVILASRRPLARDPDVLAERLAARGIRARLVGAPWLRYVLTNDRVAELAARIAAEDVPANSDAVPICYQYTVLGWLSMFLPAAAIVDIPTTVRRLLTAPGAIGGLASAVAAIFLLSRIRPTVRRSLLAAVAGFAGMLLETVILLEYQVTSGVLYQDLGLLLTVFMLGLAAGAAAVAALGRAGQERRLRGLAILVAFAGLAGLTAALVPTEVAGGLPGAAAALAATGFLVAATFAHAAPPEVQRQGAAVSPLYAADLVGGCLAAVAGSLITIPALGLEWTAAWAAASAALAVLLL